MLPPADDSEIQLRLRASAENSVARAPLNAALATIIADEEGLRGLFAAAPPTQRLPVLLLAAIHDQVLAHPAAALSQWYATVTTPPRPPDDPALRDHLMAFVGEHREAIVESLASRTTQTNEVGRCALLLPAFWLIATETAPGARAGAPTTRALAHLDVGASAGLLLGLDRYRYRYSPGGDVGPDDSPVVLGCGTRGSFPTPRLPEIAARRGLDVAPVDVTDPAAVRWLEACVWPDQHDRFQRLAAAIWLAQQDPPTIAAGAADELVDRHVTALAEYGHPVVTTSWVLNYLTPDRQHTFVASLDRVGQDLDLSWVIAEAPALTPAVPTAAEWREEYRTAVTLVRWRGGRRIVDPLAIAHPHGYWLHWRDDAPHPAQVTTGAPAG